jgi:signal transduction histidine kinase
MLSGIRQILNRNSVRWALLLPISGSLLLALLVVGVGVHAGWSSIERQHHQERLVESTRESSLRIQQYIENKQQVLSAAGWMQKMDASTIFQNLAGQDPDWLEIAQLDSVGKVLAAAPAGSTTLQNIVTRPQARWFQQTRIGSASVDLFYSGDGDTTSLIVAVPTTSGGVIAGRLRTGGLKNVLASAQTGELGAAYLVNRLDGRAFGLPGQPDGAAANTSQVFQNILDHDYQAWQAVVANAQGAEVLAQAAPVSNTTWVIVTEVGQNDTASQSAQMLPILAGSLLLVWAVLTLITNAALESLLVRPLRAVLEGSSVQPQSGELGQIARRIEHMSADLREIDELYAKARQQILVDSQFKTDFLSRVSHNLRQPMGVILGFAEMLSEEIFGAINRPQRRAVEDILTSTKSLSQMISDLLDTVRLEAQTLHLRSSEFSPELLLRQASSQVKLLAERKELKLVTALDPQLDAVLVGDANRVQQIVYNLAVNAIKFTQKGTVSIRFLRCAEDRWAICVSDTGQGISKDAVETIFEPFRQVSSQTTRDKGGVGLGLYIVQQLVLLMEGQVEVESSVGGGSNFTVILPLQTARPKGS